MKKLLVIFILALSIFLPSVVFGKDISGTAWVFYSPDGDKDVVFFENDGTVTYLQIISTQIIPTHVNISSSNTNM